MTQRSCFVILSALALAACSSEPATGDASTPADAASDAGATPDTVTADVPQADTSAPPEDVSSVDAGAATEGEVLTAAFAPWDIGLGGGFVYVAEGNNIQRVPVAGGAPTLVYTTGSNSVATQSVAADAARVAWTERNANSTVSGAVRACPHSGCATPTAIPAMESTQRVAIDGDVVAWTSASLSRVFWSAGAMGSGGSPSPGGNLSHTGPTAVAIDGGDVFWTTGGLPLAMRPGAVLRCSVGAGCSSPTELSSAVGNPNALAVRGADVFVISTTGVFRMGRDGSGLTRIAEGYRGTGGYVDAVTDGTTLYWTDAESVYRCAAAACAPAVHATAPAGQRVVGLEIDAEYVYFGTADIARRGGSVRRARR